MENNRVEYKRELTENLEKEVVAFLNARESGVLYTPQVLKLISVIPGEMDREALQDALSLSARKNFRTLYLTPALNNGLLEMTIPDKPSSRLQKCRLTGKGMATLGTIQSVNTKDQEQQQ